MAKNKKNLTQIIEDENIIDESPSHPVFQELVVIENLIASGEDELRIEQAIQSYSDSLNQIEFLENAEKDEISKAREKLKQIISRLKRNEADKFKKSLTELIGKLRGAKNNGNVFKQVLEPASPPTAPGMPEAEKAEAEKQALKKEIKDFSIESEIDKNSYLKAVFAENNDEKIEKVRYLTGKVIDIQKLDQIVRSALAAQFGEDEINIPQNCLNKEKIIPWLEERVSKAKDLGDLSVKIFHGLLPYNHPGGQKPESDKLAQDISGKSESDSVLPSEPVELLTKRKGIPTETFKKEPERVNNFDDIPEKFFKNMDAVLHPEEKRLFMLAYDVMDPELEESNHPGINNIRLELKTFFLKTYNNLPVEYSQQHISVHLNDLKQILKSLM